MAYQVKTYQFNPGARTITFPNRRTILLENIGLITNTTAGITIFDWEDSSKRGSVNNNILTLDYNTSGMSSTDVLDIQYIPIGNNATLAEVNSGDVRIKSISPFVFDKSYFTQSIANTIQTFELALLRKATDNSYSTITYTGGLVTKIELFSDAGKTIKIFTRDIVYSSEYPTSIVTKDEITGAVETQTIAWSGDVPSDINIVIS